MISESGGGLPRNLHADRASLLAAKAADFILIPCRPAKFDLEAIEATIDVANLAKKPAAVVINSAPHARTDCLIR
jgi:chromosome partitioning protein